MSTNNDYLSIEKAAKRNYRIRTGITYALLVIWALVVLFPFYWMLLTSIKSYGSYNAEYVPKFFTLSPTLQNYADAFTQVPLARYFGNTLIFAIITTGAM
ncbi:MAG: carbohydrate ABC transporter permease, partial [Solobacterium sp.]|nr:carbohydrate ABC transporter permease [Solobacterium sp.]